MKPVADVKALLLTPGANADRNHAPLVMLDEAITEIEVERLTLGTTSIAAAAKKIRAAGVNLAQRLEIDPNQVAYGGRSFGGRACSVCVAEGMPAAALVLLSYPLHPPSRPEKLRVEHFSAIDVPTLFISGDKDPFGSEIEFRKHIKHISSQITFHTVKGNHSPGTGQFSAIASHVRQFLQLEV